MFVCAVVLSITTCAYRTQHSIIESIQNSYAILQVTDMLIYHIKNHQGVPPKDWKDLEVAFQYVNTGYNSFTLPELRARVGIDFSQLARGLNVLRESESHEERGRVIFLIENSEQSETIVAEANERLWKETEGIRNDVN